MSQHHAFLGGYDKEHQPFCGACHKPIHRNFKPSAIRLLGTWSHIR